MARSSVGRSESWSDADQSIQPRPLNRYHWRSHNDQRTDILHRIACLPTLQWSQIFFLHQSRLSVVEWWDWPCPFPLFKRYFRPIDSSYSSCAIHPNVNHRSSAFYYLLYSLAILLQLFPASVPLPPTHKTRPRNGQKKATRSIFCVFSDSQSRSAYKKTCSGACIANRSLRFNGTPGKTRKYLKKRQTSFFVTSHPRIY